MNISYLKDPSLGPIKRSWAVAAHPTKPILAIWMCGKIAILRDGKAQCVPIQDTWSACDRGNELSFRGDTLVFDAHSRPLQEISLDDLSCKVLGKQQNHIVRKVAGVEALRIPDTWKQRIRSSYQLDPNNLIMSPVDGGLLLHYWRPNPGVEWWVHAHSFDLPNKGYAKWFSADPKDPSRIIAFSHDEAPAWSVLRFKGQGLDLEMSVEGSDWGRPCFTHTGDLVVVHPTKGDPTGIPDEELAAR